MVPFDPVFGAAIRALDIGGPHLTGISSFGDCFYSERNNKVSTMPTSHPSKPPQRSLNDLQAILESRDNPDHGRPVRFRGYANPTAEFELFRIRELPLIRLLAEQLGFCRPGEFSAATVRTIVDRICVHGRVGQVRIEPVTAYSLTLTTVVEFLEGLLKQARQNDAPPTESKANAPISSAEPVRWYTVTEAANIAAVNPGVISRAAELGEIRSNGKKGHERRICALDLCRWR